jgi:hypothetical protein
VTRCSSGGRGAIVRPGRKVRCHTLRGRGNTANSVSCKGSGLYLGSVAGFSCLQEINAWLPERGLSKYRTNDGRMVWDGS